MSPIRRILVASDFSKASGKAFTTALAMAVAQHAELTVLHVVQPFIPASPEPYLNADIWEQVVTEIRRSNQRLLGRLMQKAQTAGIRAAGFIVEGSPAEQIVRMARARRSDLLVLGTHGRTGLAKFFVGSVAARVVATAACPVMTVRGSQ